MKLQHLFLAWSITVIWGFNFVAAKTALDHFPPFEMLLLRFILLTAILFPFLRVPRDKLRPVLAVGFMIGVLHFSLNFSGLGMSGDVSSAAIATQLFIPMGTILAIIFLGERIGMWRAGAIAIAFSGTVVLAFDPVVIDHLDALLVVVISAVPMGIATIMLRRLTGVGPLQIQAWTGVVGIPSYLVLTVLFESGQVEALRTAPLAPLAGIVYAVLAASLIGHGGLYFLLQRYPVSWVNPLFLLAPIFAVLFGVTVYGDRPTMQIFVGGFMTIAGVAVIAIRSARKGAPIAEKVAP
ncbi:MAG: DMT family transporter [Proteobacteria bacterium]|nr:DMT family transporter [Pseudomonadota bacterium]MDA1057615.1 DMT family transporter [Pseudomonadota bacterium]